MDEADTVGHPDLTESLGCVYTPRIHISAVSECLPTSIANKDS